MRALLGIVDGRDRDRITHVNRAAPEQVRAQAAAMHESAQDTGWSQALQMGARFGEPAADALDTTDPKAKADERVEVDAARDDIAPRLLPADL